MSDVPCNGCTACCRQQVVLLSMEDEPNMAAYDYRHVGDLRVLNNKPNGDCTHLGPEGCTIYENRPFICRTYDCRKHFKKSRRPRAAAILQQRARGRGAQATRHARRRRSCRSAELPSLKPMTNPKHVGILHQLARTGGTIINRCLGCMRNIVMLSELHSTKRQGLRFHPLYQAGQWFDLISPEERATLRSNAEKGGWSFGRSMELIEERTRLSGRHLLIREFSHADFLLTSITRPVFRSRMVDELGKLYALRRSAVVRHPLDQWRSMQDYPATRERCSLADYLKGHRRFAEMALEVGFVRYEDFCRDPADDARTVVQRSRRAL